MLEREEASGPAASPPSSRPARRQLMAWNQLCGLVASTSWSRSLASVGLEKSWPGWRRAKLEPHRAMNPGGISSWEATAVWWSDRELRLLAKVHSEPARWRPTPKPRVKGSGRRQLRYERGCFNLAQRSSVAAVPGRPVPQLSTPRLSSQAQGRSCAAPLRSSTSGGRQVPSASTSVVALSGAAGR